MHVGLISDGCGEAQRVLILHEQQACLKACVVSVVSDRVDPCQSTQRHYATAATRPHQRIAQGAAALRHADARYRSAAAGRISATLTTHKPRIGGACSQHAVRRITSAGQDPPYVGRVLTRRTAVLNVTVSANAFHDHSFCDQLKSNGAIVTA